MSTPTVEDVINAAATIATDAAEGRLDPAALDVQLEAACRDMVGTVVGEGDPLWALQLQIAHGVLAAGGIEPDTLSEWAAVGRRRANPDGDLDGQGGAEAADGPDALLTAESDASGPHSAEIGTTPDDAVADVEPADVEPVQLTAEPVPADDCGCSKVAPPVVTADGRTIPARLVAARGRGLPGDNGLRPI